MEKKNDMILILDDRKKLSISKKLENFIVYLEFPYFCCLFPIVLILIIIILCSGEFNDGIYNNLIENWKMNPIITINLIDNNKKEKKTQKNLGIFKGIKNPKKYKNTILTNWRSKNFEFEFLNDFSYKNIIKNSIESNKINNYKICGKDSENNSLYFPNNIECPINFIEITNKTKSSIDGKYNYKTLNLSNNLFLYYSNEYIEGEILVQLKVSSKEGMCFKLKYDNDFAPYILNYNIKNKKRGCINNLYDERLKIIDEDLIENFLENNNIKEDVQLNETYCNYTQSKIYLYKRGYIGVSESFTINEIKKVINAPLFARIKNFFSFFLSFFYLFYTIINNFEFFCGYKIKFLYDMIFVIIFSFPVIILFLIEIINDKILKKILISISSIIFYKYKKNIRFYIKIDFCILIFLLFLFILKFFRFLQKLYVHCMRKRTKQFYVPKELIKKLYKHRIKLLEDKKHENKFIEKSDLKNFKNFLKKLYLKNNVKINLDDLRDFNDNNYRYLRKYLNLLYNYKIE